MYAIVKGSSILLGVKSMMEDMGIKLSAILYTDSSAAKGMMTKRGLGRTKHVDLRYMWVQDIARERRLEIIKITGIDNCADLMTKHVCRAQLEKCLRQMNCDVSYDRHRLAPSVELDKLDDIELFDNNHEDLANVINAIANNNLKNDE